jgi:hypothetical protein
MTTASSAPGLAQTFWLIINGLREAVARRSAARHSETPVLVLVWGRLNRLAQRFAALVAHVEAGTLRPPRRGAPLRRRAPPPEETPPPGEATPPREPSPPGGPPPPGGPAPPDPAAENPPRPPRKRYPEAFGWLIRALPYEAACFGSQLQHQFSQPEMIALIEAAPQVGRILRPLCQILAIELPPSLRLPPRPPRRRRARPKPERGQPAKSSRSAEGRPRTRRPAKPPPPGEDGTVHEWRRWRSIWMPEPVRSPKPA